MKKLLLKYDREIAAAAVLLVVFSGVLRFFSYQLGIYVLKFALYPFLLVKLLYYILAVNDFRSSEKQEKQSFIVFLFLLLLAVLDMVGIMKADFLMFFLLIVLYLLISKRQS